MERLYYSADLKNHEYEESLYDVIYDLLRMTARPNIVGILRNTSGVGNGSDVVIAEVFCAGSALILRAATDSESAAITQAVDEYRHSETLKAQRRLEMIVCTDMRQQLAAMSQLSPADRLKYILKGHGSGTRSTAEATDQ